MAEQRWVLYVSGVADIDEAADVSEAEGYDETTPVRDSRGAIRGVRDPPGWCGERRTMSHEGQDERDDHA